jgi:hypothetical protein
MLGVQANVLCFSFLLFLSIFLSPLLSCLSLPPPVPLRRKGSFVHQSCRYPELAALACAAILLATRLNHFSAKRFLTLNRHPDWLTGAVST